MKTGRYVHNCYPFSKFEGFVSERRSFLSSRIRAFRHWKNIPFSPKWVRAYALIGRVWGWGWWGEGWWWLWCVLQIRIQSSCYITFNYPYALFVLSLCRRWYRIDEVSWAIFLRVTLPDTLIFVAITKDINNWQRPNHSKIPKIANCMYKSYEIIRTLYLLQLVNVVNWEKWYHIARITHLIE